MSVIAEVKNTNSCKSLYLEFALSVPVCSGGSKQNGCEAYRVDISLIIRAGTLGSKVAVINNCSNEYKCEQALARVHACSGAGMQSSALDTYFQILTGKFKG